MSKIGKKPITVPGNVEIKVADGIVSAKGAKGTLEFKPHPLMVIKLDGKTLTVERTSENNLDKSLHGLTRTIISNMIEGVSNGFTKKLEIQGVGYRAAMAGKSYQLSLGFSHPIMFDPPAGITLDIDKEKKNILIVSGVNKEIVGQVAANLRSLRVPEPYKGKGIRYLGEQIRRKAGKAAATAAK
jgi:large subunit ribosomal protein L6